MVNGLEVILTEQEETNTRAYWDLNLENPEFEDACSFDGINPPSYDMEIIKAILTKKFDLEKEKALLQIAENIESAQEDEEDVSLLFAERKMIKSLTCPDFSDCEDIETAKIEYLNLENMLGL